MVELNGGSPQPVCVQSKLILLHPTPDSTLCGSYLYLGVITYLAGSLPEDGSLEIGDTTAFSPYLRGGVVTEVKRPKTVRHVSASACEVGAPGFLSGCIVFQTSS